MKLSRRRFLIASGWVAGGATALFLLGRRAQAVAPTIIYPDGTDAANWIQIRPDGRCFMFLPRQDMGQNANTGIAQIVAEELNLEVEHIVTVLPNTTEVPPLAVTAGSMSLTAFSRPTSIAAATLRESLRQLAASHFGVSSNKVGDAPGGFVSGTRKVVYAELVQNQNLLVEIDGQGPEPKLYTFDPNRNKTQVGRGAAPLGIRDMVTGVAQYSADVRVEGAVYGRTIQPPVKNAQIQTLDVSGVESTKGFIKLVHQDDFVGVVCNTPSSVNAALDKVKVTWKLQQPIDEETLSSLIDVDADLQQGSLERTLEEQDHRDDVSWDIDLKFEVQLQSHAAQEVRSSTAHFNAQLNPEAEHKLEIWTGTQDAWAIKRYAAMDTGLSEDDIVVYPQRMGGGFGGREHYEVERDAVRLSMAVNQPVKVQWTRRDEFLAARNRPPSNQRIRLAVDEKGNLSDWWHAYKTGHVIFARERLPGWLLPVARLAEDFGVAAGAHSSYAVPHYRTEYSDIDLPVDLGVWRSLNAGPAIFSIESAVDELALQLGRDSVEYRVSQIKDTLPRLKTCLERVSQITEEQPLPKGEHYGRGFACGIYEERCFAAVGADVYVDKERKQIKVLRICCVQDVGQAINPDQLKAQMESNMVWSVGMTLMERLDLGDDDILTSNFDNYSIARMADTPEIVTEVIDQPDIPPAGAGEVALIAGPGAIANAIRRAAGTRALRLPIRFDDLNL
jgi:CO/xanthine dehydrogenase Mo-binding subunit